MRVNKRYVVIVEDDLTVLHSLRLEIQNILPPHYAVETANDGAEALELVKEIIHEGYLVPLIITDHQMPVMTGSEFILEVKSLNPRGKNVMLTGEAGLSEIAKLVNEQALYRYLTKPWNHSDLEMTMLSAMESFNQEYKLEKLNKQLSEINENLEKIVDQRTLELNRKTRELNNGMDFASLMQKNLLPSLSDMREFFPTIDFLFRPHSHVSGDFYAFKNMENGKGCLVIGDCTGHGVAGAFLSSICMSILNGAFEQGVVFTPKQILFEVLQRMRKFSKKAEQSIEAMISVELSVLRIDNPTRKIYSATNSRQLLFFKDGIQHLPESKPFECCVGNNSDGDRLKNRGKEITVSFDDVDKVILFTDGISDQFKSSTGKKIYRRGIVKALPDIQKLGCNKWFDEMKSKEDQIDDATMLIIDVE
ncbi:response regulator [Flavobacteriales bacterium]|nr:response regulator [Flavobacteriales bacterium]